MTVISDAAVLRSVLSQLHEIYVNLCYFSFSCCIYIKFNYGKNKIMEKQSDIKYA